MVKEFTQLLNTYRKMFGMVDAFHFNSFNTANVYNKFIEIPDSSRVITITHSGIINHRKHRKYYDSILNLGFIGSEAPYKGLPLLKEVINRLNGEGYSKKLVLHVFGGRSGQDANLSNVVYDGRFTPSDIKKVFDNIDLLVVPSVWNETFSLVTLEALSYGTCVLVSDRVGAKDIVKKYTSDFVFKTEEDLYGILKKLLNCRDELIQYNKRCIESPWEWSMEEHSKSIVEQLYV